LEHLAPLLLLLLLELLEHLLSLLLLLLDQHEPLLLHDSLG